MPRPRHAGFEVGNGLHPLSKDGRTLWLHIGHDKTGSSWLQSLFALNAGALRAQGVHYPIDPKAAALAAAGQATTGNGRQQIALCCPSVPRQFERETRGVLLSFEGFFNQLVRQPKRTMHEIRAYQSHCGCERISVLLFTRDPIAHAASSYQQLLRSGGMTLAPEDFYLTYNRPRDVWRTIRFLDAQPDVDLSVYNYSRERRHMRALTAGWLSVDPDVLAQDPPRPVNRGLSFDEIAALRRINMFSPAMANKVAKGFELLYPGEPSASLVPNRGVQKRMIEKNEDAMAMVNRWLVDPKQRYSVDFSEPTTAQIPERLSARVSLRIGLAWVRGRLAS